MLGERERVPNPPHAKTQGRLAEDSLQPSALARLAPGREGRADRAAGSPGRDVIPGLSSAARPRTIHSPREQTPGTFLPLSGVEFLPTGASPSSHPSLPLQI